MTRRGTLIYYLTAWAIGCFSVTLSIWIKDLITSGFPVQDRAFALLAVAFYAMVFGAALSLLGGFLLRKLMGALKCRTPLHWAVVGAVVAPALVAAFAFAGRKSAALVPSDASLLGAILEVVGFVFFFGANAVTTQGWWLAVPAGAVTAYFLGRVERAFAPPRPNA